MFVSEYFGLDDEFDRIGVFDCVLNNDSIGSFDDEPQTVAAMHEYARQQGYELDISGTRYHHEIYLSNLRRCEVNKLKTVVRHPIKKK